jgi:hypothetical protein
MGIMENNNAAGEKSRMEEIQSALSYLGYAQNGLADAARRISWAPDIASELIEYVRIGAPGYAAGMDAKDFPKMLTRPLLAGHTIAGFITNFLQEPVGAFLLAAALTSHPSEALLMIEKIIAEGQWKRLTDGRYALVRVPASDKYASCPNCALRLTRQYKSCPRCSFGLAKPIDAEPVQRPLTCTRCGTTFNLALGECPQCRTSAADIYMDISTAAETGVL